MKTGKSKFKIYQMFDGTIAVRISEPQNPCFQKILDLAKKHPKTITATVYKDGGLVATIPLDYVSFEDPEACKSMNRERRKKNNGLSKDH